MAKVRTSERLLLLTPDAYGLAVGPNPDEEDENEGPLSKNKARRMRKQL